MFCVEEKEIICSLTYFIIVVIKVFNFFLRQLNGNPDEFGVLYTVLSYLTAVVAEGDFRRVRNILGGGGLWPFPREIVCNLYLVNRD